jgi:hypothetical protein
MAYFEIDGWKAKEDEGVDVLPGGATQLIFEGCTVPEHHAYCYDDRVHAIPITSLDTYIRECVRITPCTSHTIWYRGQLSRWSITASIFRDTQLLESEHELIETILTNYPEEFQSCHSFFSKLVKLKHYSCPSRLLDVTGNSLIALFFALQGMNERDCPFGVVYTCFSKRDQEYFESHQNVAKLVAISKTDNSKCYVCPVYTANDQSRKPTECRERPSQDKEKGCQLLRSLVFNAQALNEEFETDDDLTLDSFKGCVFVKPPMNNQRIIQQQGAFLIVGRNAENPSLQCDDVKRYFYVPSDYSPLQSNGTKSAIDETMYRKQYVFVIPYTAKETLLRGLDELGINDAFVFPEIERRINYYKKKLGSNHEIIV